MFYKNILKTRVLLYDCFVIVLELNLISWLCNLCTVNAFASFLYIKLINV